MSRDAAEAPPTPERPAPVHSYKRRRGRMSTSKLEALARLGPRWALDAEGPIDLPAAYGRTAPVLLDVGFGDGRSTVAYATAHPHHDVLAVDVHTTGIAHLLRAVEDHGLANVRIADADVVDLVDRLAPGSIQVVHVYFPDPWPKRRHHHRRLLQPTFLGRLAQVLVPGGRLQVATDWLDYAEEIRAGIGTEPRLRFVPGGPGGCSPRPADRPVTTYERRGIAAGRTIHDLVAERLAGA